MRISTTGLFMGAVNAMIEQQSALSRSQSQIASGHRVNTAADDPIAAVRILDLSRAQSESEQYGKNSDIARSRLNIEDQALSASTTAMQQVRELLVQAGNTATLSDGDRSALATQLAQITEQLTGIANRKDGNGDFIFSGLSAKTQPFSTDANGTVSYAGDQLVRKLQIASGQTITDAHSGYDAFMNVKQGNGTFVTAGNTTNTGSASMDAGTVTNVAAWIPDNYTLSFTSSTAWRVVDSSNNVVATGAYASGAAISFNGAQVTVSGVPAAGDTFSINRSRTEDMFTTLNNLVATLRTPSSGATKSAQLATALSAGLQQLDQMGEHLSDVQAQVGARLNILDDTDSSRADLSIDLQTSISNLRDIDYASAVTKLNQQVAGLQAAQLSYSKLSGLSLFNYMR